MGDFSKDINSTFPNNKVKAMLNVIYTANWISSRQNTFFKPFNISSQQYNVLRILKGAKAPLKVQTIKERMVERSPNATRLMDKLYAKGLIDRIPCPTDRRVVFIKITTNGLQLLDNVNKANRADIFKNLTEEEAVQLSDLLDKIR
ncbi:MarR family winged helix-turn-helix transcriptional regulator [Formosa algae]|uniref:DNA-binding MarR family transcriptional regulator n=1 Tax=Formosa algae TaxID=225843 RepID=A0A9X0YPM8_9FLAO|nr:MarR family transcriptional regulator [Formosa algae]MBP1841062.1 DNA-binding MarR family transcriptional regulator [Formosa algae]MDQ0336518.1 DNA-binding MarR family transcriptional regulator [Formosa algae]OEI81476.1 MarR family transcriptional regulator [Formosa algae]PNW25824.1 MarR family transcriptional regulator [Formosa algae]